MNRIEKFIEDFKAPHREEIEDIFLHGYCYWFARMLTERFAGEIWYNPIENHFVAHIGHYGFYDISGRVRKTGYALWSEYRKLDRLESDRIIRDCILKLN